MRSLRPFFILPFVALVSLPLLGLLVEPPPPPPAPTPRPTILSRLIDERVVPPPPPVPDDTLWLARAIFSETKKAFEQELVAWTIRNRVETNYRRKTSYKSTVLDPWQFSAFNRNSPTRSFYLGLERASNVRGWQRTLTIARDVLLASEDHRPFSKKTRHFYSEISMQEGEEPEWARNKKPVKLRRRIDPKRFRFYANVA